MPSGLFALLDDIGALVDDMALAKGGHPEATGILGDDLALFAEKSISLFLQRIACTMGDNKGSLLNKVIIIYKCLCLMCSFGSHYYSVDDWWGYRHKLKLLNFFTKSIRRKNRFRRYMKRYSIREAKD